ncbi:MAG: hypothetical protein LBP34_00195 [Flavobacteriaceae bacterium]|jgi:hypothetical protein|nr:hypothetical protein [Flavobacteriaceae bacterium]
MKKFVLFLFILFSIGLFAQKGVFQIKKDTIRNRTFTGKIGNYPVTLHLEYANLSDGHGGIYSLRGWYYYDKYKKQIPLVGIYDGGYTLYVFNDKKLEKKVVDFKWESNTDSFWDYVDKYKNLHGYKEKLIFTEGIYFNDRGIIKEWNDGKKKLKFELNDSDSGILEYKEFLIFPDNHQVNLPESLHDRGFELVNYKMTDRGAEVLLEYNYFMRAYALGTCGVGAEVGYWLLKFDQSNQLQEQKRIPLESCEYGISYEIVDNDVTPHIEVFHLTSNYSEFKLPKKVTVNLSDITIEEYE